MQGIEDQTFDGMTDSIDDKHFIRCKIKDCVLACAGGDFAFAETQFEGNISFTFEGPAMRTIGFLKMFNVRIDQLSLPGAAIAIPLPSKKALH